MRVDSDYLVIGKVIKPFGLRGEMKVFPITDNIERFNTLPFIFFNNGHSFNKVDVESVRYSKKFVLLKLNLYNTRSDIEGFCGQYIYIDRKNAVKLDETGNYYYDLTGCEVKTGDGNIIGTIYDIQNTGSCDIYIVRRRNGKQDDLLIPAIKQVVKKIDIDRKEIIIEIIDGLF